MGLAQSWRGCVVRSGAAAGSAGASLPHRPFRAPTWLAPVLLAGLAALPTAAREPASITTAAAGDGQLPLADEVGGAVERAMAAGQIPGAVVTIGTRGRILFEGAFGARTLSPEREPATLDTLYDLASLTKPIATATGVLILADRGKLELDAPVARYLPEFGARGKQAITVEDLLRHWGGLVADNSLADYRHGPEETWRRICELELSAPPRAQLLYSDVGYVVLGKLVERLDGRPLERFAREEIFAPLAMGSSGFLPGADLRARCAPTEQRTAEDGSVHWMRGEVHDPRAFALGGVAGHAGLFSTASDVSRWCRMVLGGGQLDGRRVLTPHSAAALLTARALPGGGGERTLGLDAGHGTVGGELLPAGVSAGHSGFTGTSLWLDPASDGFAVVLSNRVHPDGRGEAGGLRRAVAHAAARAFRAAGPVVLTGADILEREGCARLWGRRVALLTNHTGRTAAGVRTIDLLRRAEGVTLVCILAPEHGLGARAEGTIAKEIDPASGLTVHSLYGEARKPTADMLAGADTLVIDLQDVGTRIYTYGTTLALALEAAGELGVRCLVLDRPDPLGPLARPGAWGPLADAGRLDFTSYRPIPLVHGLTLGELARLNRDSFGVAVELEVIPCEGWRRSMTWAQTGLEWRDPSPNLRNPTATLLYPGLALLETTNVSVGRGTDAPFERFGAPWIDGPRLARALNLLALPGVEFTPIRFVPTSSTFHGQECSGVHVAVTDRALLRPVEAGLAIGRTLRELFGSGFEFEKIDRLLRNRATLAGLESGASLAEIAKGWGPDLQSFEEARARAMLYPP